MRATLPLTTATLVVLIVPLFALAAYVAGYFWLGEYRLAGWNGLSRFKYPRIGIVRTYPSEWQTTLFTPAARLEAELTQREVYVRTSAFVEIGDGSVIYPVNE